MPPKTLLLLVRSIIVLAALFATAAFLLSLPNAHAVATTLTVNSLADTDDGNCDSSPNCTLREAINAANSNAGHYWVQRHWNHKPDWSIAGYH